MFGRLSVLTCGLLVTALTLGCQSNKKDDRPALQAPQVTTALKHFAGSALSGPQMRTIDDASMDKIWGTTIRAWAVDQLPVEGFSPIAQQARLIIASRAGTPVTPSARLTNGFNSRSIAMDFDIQTLLGEEKRHAQMHTSQTGVTVGSTVELEIDIPRGAEPIIIPTRTGLTFRITRVLDNGTYELAVSSRDLIPVAMSVSDTPPPANTNTDNNGDTILPAMRVETETEMLILDRKVEGETDRYVLALPVRFPESDAKGIVVEFSVQTLLADDKKSEAIAAFKQGLLESADRLHANTILTTGSAEELAMRTALTALMHSGDVPRGALAYLAGESGATLTEQVVMIADAALLSKLAKSVAETSEGLQKFDRANVAWLLERMTMASISASENDVQHPLQPAVIAVMSSYAGEAGRQVDSLKSLIGQSNGTADLQNRLIVENRVFLEDSSPASRVRAYDWLKARGHAPEGYDPLGPVRQRRAALDKASGATPVVVPAPMQTTQPTH